MSAKRVKCRMHIGILIIGDEIITGRRADQHFPHVVKVLNARGLQLAWTRYVGDDEELLVQQFREINISGDLCFSFGGIGATLDDRTRQAVAHAHELPLFRHPGAVKAIEQQFGANAYPHRILMADLPQGATLIPNPFNNVPGFSLGRIHCLPGFPEMAWPMLAWVLDSCYADLKGLERLYLSLLVVKSHESELMDIMDGLQARFPRIKVSSLPRFLPEGGTEVELGVSGAVDETQAAYDVLEAELSRSNRIFHRCRPVKI